MRVTEDMLHLYVLYACMHFTKHAPASQARTTSCVEQQVFFRADDCKRSLPGKGGLMGKNKYAQSWLECQATQADSWIPEGPDGGAPRLYKAQASVSDGSALAALLAPLSPQAREELKRRSRGTFQGPGNRSFFVVGDDSTLIVFAVTNLDDFQFADIAADVSSFQGAGKDLDFSSMAEMAGVELSYPTQLSHRAMPTPGGVKAAPSR